MSKTELYKKIGMDKFFWGDCFQIERDSKTSNVVEFLDQICVSEKLKSLNGKWRKIEFDDCSELFLNALNFDLAYKRCEQMSKEQATVFQKSIIEIFDKTDTECFTNWSANPWKEQNGGGRSSITESTFDMAIVFADLDKIVFTYFISED